MLTYTVIKKTSLSKMNLTTLLQIWHKCLTGKGVSTVHITWTFSIRNLAKTDLQVFRHLFTQNSKDVFKLNELLFVWSQFLHKFSMLKESLCLVLSQIPWTKTKLEHIWVLLNQKEKKLVWTKKRKYKTSIRPWFNPVLRLHRQLGISGWKSRQKILRHKATFFRAITLPISHNKL